MLDSALMGVIAYPQIDPVLVHLGPLAIRWYSLAYIAGLLFGWWFIRRQSMKPGAAMSAAHMDDFLTWAILGVILGGRTGYVLFYNLPFYIQHPAEIFKLWDGGMSFHGGALGVILAVIFFCKKNKLDLMRVADVVAVVTPAGLFAGRIANFINGELWGRPTDVPWAMVFPHDPTQLPRHPSQLYEAFGEGIILFLILQFLFHKTRVAKEMPGFIAGVFFAGYGLTRILVEFVRMPDVQVGLYHGISRGQMLSVPMFLFAAWLMWQGIKRKRASKKA
ncbi:prolipoprotein diacylglyceryl transferase [Kordiimonas marina]|uniref:prolipoprotein diacylglyceryl transferase n=1 Tax=Kordiimonas marina TaxID=2872312 RepID=UPI001FF38B85|nr:prolipoprotein diacylglyceryl transferase [Kordiimonas marina]MCJ9429702.1 prolipoprotein diacylglyceryl transferase [Kordiimonas marina]